MSSSPTFDPITSVEKFMKNIENGFDVDKCLKHLITMSIPLLVFVRFHVKRTVEDLPRCQEYNYLIPSVIQKISNLEKLKYNLEVEKKLVSLEEELEKKNCDASSSVKPSDVTTLSSTSTARTSADLEKYLISRKTAPNKFLPRSKTISPRNMTSALVAPKLSNFAHTSSANKENKFQEERLKREAKKAKGAMAKVEENKRFFQEARENRERKGQMEMRGGVVEEPEEVKKSKKKEQNKKFKPFGRFF